MVPERSKTERNGHRTATLTKKGRCHFLQRQYEAEVPYRRYIEEGHKKMPRKFLDEKTYSDAIQAFVVVCADVVPINRERKTFYLTKRASKPIQGWWELGGRIFAGEPEHEAIIRIVKQETGLELPSKRFSLVSKSRYFCKDREQEPQDIGCDSFVYHFIVELSKEELQAASENLDRKEYELDAGLHEFNRERIISEKVPEAILDLYDTVFPQKR